MIYILGQKILLTILHEKIVLFGATNIVKSNVSFISKTVLRFYSKTFLLPADFVFTTHELRITEPLSSLHDAQLNFSRFLFSFISKRRPFRIV